MNMTKNRIEYINNYEKYYKDNGINYDNYSKVVKSYAIENEVNDLEKKSLFKKNNGIHKLLT